MQTDFISTEPYSQLELQTMLDTARRFRDGMDNRTLQGKTVALVFFNPSLRTRTSFETGIFQLGGHAIILSPGKDAWPMEFASGAIMDGDAEEHIQEAARVLSSYCDAIAVRAFPKFENWQHDRTDPVIKAFVQYSTVPVINMETIVHPCQELALMMTLQDKLGTMQNKKFVLTWTYHPKPLNTAVANSALLIATKFGLDVTLLCPTPEYVLDPHYMQQAEGFSRQSGGSVTVSHDIEAAYQNADMVYAKSWGALPYFGHWEKEKPIRDQYQHFRVDETKMALTNNAYFSHCLPLRRNVKATDAVIDSPNSLIMQEAANRLHVQKAVLTHLLSQEHSHD